MDGIGTILFDKTDRILIELFGQVGGLYTEEGILKLLESNTVLLAGGERSISTSISHPICQEMPLWHSSRWPQTLGSNPQSLESAQVSVSSFQTDRAAHVKRQLTCVHILKEDALRSHHQKSTSESHDADIR
ncbi:hypothetical protein G6F42_009935 [Rhizopus arrhizus]|nr:hypothetical protein G6F42_009935 [Rhizopus arrhizus]